MTKSWRMAALAVVGFSAALAGCELLALAGGHGSQKALYTFGKDQRVLVLVDIREAVQVPPLFETNLAEKVNQHLFKYKAADRIVSQERLMAVRDKDPEAFKKMGIADIAAACDADVILNIYVTRMATPVTSDNMVGQGDAEVYVKVVDRKGARLWPGDALGVRVVSHQEQALTSDRNVAETVEAISKQLAMRTGRMFHKYSLEDRDLTK